MATGDPAIDAAFSDSTPAAQTTGDSAIDSAFSAPQQKNQRELLPNGQPATGNPDIDNAIRNAYKPTSLDTSPVGKAIEKGVSTAVNLPDIAGQKLADTYLDPQTSTKIPSGPEGIPRYQVGAGFGGTSPAVATALRLLPHAASLAGGGAEAGESEVAGRDAQSLLNQRALNSPQSTSAAAAAPQLAQASPELQAAAARAAQKSGGAINPEVWQRHVEADSLPVKMQLTEGQATQSPGIISNEQNMRGKNEALRTRFNEQNGQLVQNVQALRDQVGPEVFSTNPVEHGETLINAYKAKDAAAQSDISQKYQQLRDVNGGQFPVDAQKLLDNASANLHQQLLFDHAPKPIMSTLSRLADNGNMSFENFESLRTNLARIQRSPVADGNEQAAAGVIRNAMENLPLADGAAKLKPIADTARAAAKAQFDALDADPAYKAAVNETVPPDRFVQKYIVSAPKNDVATMKGNLAGDDSASQTMGVAAIDHLRAKAGIDSQGNGNFSQAGYNRHLEALAPKADILFDPKTAEQLQTLGNVARYTQFQPRGSFVNNSNTFVSQAAEHAKGAIEGAANVMAKGVPVGTWTRNVMEGRSANKAAQRALEPGAGLGSLSDYIKPSSNP